MADKKSLVFLARKSAGLTQPEVAKLLGVSATRLVTWERDPDTWMTPNKLRVYYDNVGDEGKQILRQYASSFFTQ